ncbi:hypothetical protein SASPL_131178 [Salvia splendens]|uniref:Trichome birefringence-like N-terminal domain-containing protein n=1 Tax=Salvia splendens TaxID=180675 RepID=A0A8X8X8S0_SALSN|nr:protein trichome birefringence-like 19 [Salvia splendens]KAG6408174.1 hypothetical protein SASPL_131178 [Salvia splendens]
MELPVNKGILNTAILVSIALITATLIYPVFHQKTSSSVSTYFYNAADDTSQDGCNIFTGEWVPDPDAPYYTNNTCWAIHEHQNCMKYGRPDSDFIKWKWKPEDCDLPSFNPSHFLHMLRDKSMAFVGDSVGRNQMQSMICLLSKVEYPIDDSPTSDEQFKRWKYADYNFTLEYFRSPFLVRSEERDPDGPTHTGLFNLHLDEFDESWTSHIDSVDYLVLNAGHWFTRPAVYYENRRVAGCHFCQLPNTTDLPVSHAYRRAIRTALRAVNSRRGFGGVALLRTFAPSHFEGGLWNEGGDCVRRRPFRRGEAILEGADLDLYMIELEEFRAAEKLGKKRWRLMDATQAMVMRPDGHPSKYGHWPNQNVTLYNDCVHWCLPGPIDNWAQMLQHMIMLEARRDYKDGFFKIQ